MYKVFFIHTSAYRHPECFYVLSIDLSFLIALTNITYAMLMNAWNGVYLSLFQVLVGLPQAFFNATL